MKFSKMFKALSLLLVIVMVAGCQSGSGDKKVRIGILQFVEHPALDSSREGFIDALADLGYVDGENIIIDYKNAQEDQSNLKTISQNFINSKCDLILAIATPAAIAVANDTKDIPILITAVTDAEDAGLVESNSKPNTNVTGTSDLTPVREQIDLLFDLYPQTRNVALLYSSGESNSLFQANMAEEYLVELGIDCTHKTISTINDAPQIIDSIAENFDAIYIPTDNKIANAMPVVANAAIENKIPVIVGEQGMTENGGLASIGINYYTLGYKTGEMAEKILKGTSKPQDMAIEYAPQPDLFINSAMAEALGTVLPDHVAESAIFLGE